MTDTCGHRATWMLRHSFMPCSRSSTTRLPTSPRREAEYGRAGSAPSDIMELKDWRSPWTSSEKAALARSGEREPSRNGDVIHLLHVCKHVTVCTGVCTHARTHTHTHTHTHTRCTIHYTLHTTHRAWRGAANASPPAACPAPSRNGADVACCCGCAGVPFLVCWIAGWRSEVLAFPFRGSLLSAPFRSGLP